MCEHKWRRIHEEFLLGGSFPVGYRCVECNQFVSDSQLTPLGMGGVLLDEDELVGPHGCCSSLSDGSVYRRQIYNKKTNTLTIERPDGSIEVRDLPKM
jgi:hypothetical protein